MECGCLQLTFRYAVLLLTLQPIVYAFSVFLSMWTQGQVHVLNAGQSVELDCEFYAETFSMFNNPVIWKKFQRQEQREVNIMGNILPPFFGTGRFQVTLTTNPPRYRLRLKIADLSLEDSGNYTCEVRGPKSSIMAAVTHYIFIRAPVEDLFFMRENATADERRPGLASRSRLQQVTFEEKRSGRLRCASVGGYPPPELTVYLGERDVTAAFERSTAATLHGEPGLRLMRHRTELWTERLAVTAADDGLAARCVAAVSGLGANTTAVRVLVNYGPIVRCQRVSAFVGQRNVQLTCDVRARPGLTSLFWLIDRNGTAVTEGVIVDEYWSLNMDRNDGVITSSLFMRQANARSFRTYTLHAQNSVAVTTADLTLVREHRAASTPRSPPSVGRHKSPRDRGTAPINPRYVVLADSAAAAAGTTATHAVVLVAVLSWASAAAT